MWRALSKAHDPALPAEAEVEVTLRGGLGHCSLPRARNLQAGDTDLGAALFVSPRRILHAGPHRTGPAQVLASFGAFAQCPLFPGAADGHSGVCRVPERISDDTLPGKKKR